MSAGIVAATSRAVRRFGPVIGGTAGSQLMSALGLILIARVYAGHLSDTYVIGLQLATAPISGVVLGVVYNVALGRPGFSHWWRVCLGTAVFGAVVATVVAVVSGSRFVEATSSADAESIAIVTSLAIGGLILSSLGVFAVRDALHGRPMALAMLSLPANVGMVVAVGTVVVLRIDHSVPWLPAVVWGTAAAVQGILVVLRSYRRLGSPVNDREVAEIGKSRGASELAGHIFALSLGAVTSTIFPTLYVSIASTLAAGTATIVFIAGRLGAAGIGLFVNAILTVQYRWAQGARPNTAKIATWAAALSLPCSLFAYIARAFQLPQMYTYIAVVFSLFCLLAATAFVLRELNARVAVRAVMLKAAIDLLMSVALLFLYAQNPSVTGYFGVLAASQSVTQLVGAAAMRLPLLGILSAISLIASFGYVIYGW